MKKRKKPQITIEEQIRPIPNTAINVIKNPLGFFQDMPRDRGLLEPLIFMVSMGIIAGIVRIILGLIFGKSFMAALASIIIFPIILTITGMAVAVILFGIWILMGSREPFETAFRCTAYITAITPITTIVNLIPYAGSALWLLWISYLLIIASIHVHGVEPKIAWIVFCVIFVVFSYGIVSLQLTAG